MSESLTVSTSHRTSAPLLRSFHLARALPDLVAVGALAVCVVLFLWNSVARGLVPAGYDLLLYFYPGKAYLGDLLRHGQIPLWNPLVFLGVPLLGNIQVGVLYPPNLLFYFFSALDALRASIALHFLLAGLGTYLFARVSLGLSPGSAWLAGAIFAFGGYIGGRVGHLNVLHSAVWLPVILLCAHEAVVRRSARIAAAGSLACAVQFFAGNTQLVYYSVVVLGAFTIHMMIFGGLTGRARFWPILVTAAMGLGALLVSAVQLLPALELTQQSYRSGGVPYGQAIDFSVPPHQLLYSILPLYQHAPYIEFAGFVAASSLPLVPAALASRARRSHACFLLVLTLLSLTLALGEFTPVYEWLYGWLPGLDHFRVPGRWLFVSSLSFALLAGMGLESLEKHVHADQLRRWLGWYGIGLLAGIGSLAAFRSWLSSMDKAIEIADPQFALTWGLLLLASTAGLLVVLALGGSNFGRLALTGLVLAELFVASGPLEYNSPALPRLYTDPPALARVLAQQPASRVLSLAHDDYELPDSIEVLRGLPGDMTNVQVDAYLGLNKIMRTLPPDTTMAYGLGSIDGAGGGVLPTSRWVRLNRTLFGSKGESPELNIRQDSSEIPSSKTLGAFGVGYLIVNEGFQGLDDGWEAVEGDSSEPLRLLRNRNSSARAYVVHTAHAYTSDRSVLGAVRSLDLAQVVALNEGVDFQAPRNAGTDRVSIGVDRPNEVVVSAELEEPGFLVLSDSYYPGWKAYVDGQEMPLLRANYAVRAVQLGSGSHSVRFAYEPLSVITGAALSAIGLALLLAVLLGLLGTVQRILASPAKVYDRP